MKDYIEREVGRTVWWHMKGESPKGFHTRIKEQRRQGRETSEDDRFKAEFLAETSTLTRDFRSKQVRNKGLQKVADMAYHQMMGDSDFAGGSGSSGNLQQDQKRPRREPKAKLTARPKMLQPRSKANAASAAAAPPAPTCS